MKNILLLENDPELNEAVARLLSDHSVFRAHSVVDATNHLEGGHRLDAAVVDFWLPEGTAIPILEALKKNHPKTRTIVVSDGNQRFTPELTEALSTVSGADVFLLKPFRQEDLICALEAFFLETDSIV